MTMPRLAQLTAGFGEHNPLLYVLLGTVSLGQSLDAFLSRNVPGERPAPTPAPGGHEAVMYALLGTIRLSASLRERLEVHAADLVPLSVPEGPDVASIRTSVLVSPREMLR